jgi:hypothetical protein
MVDETQKPTVTLEELVVSTLAMTDALGQAFNSQGRHHRRRIQGAAQR